MDQLLITYNSLQLSNDQENQAWHSAWRICKNEVLESENTHGIVKALSKLSKTRNDERLYASSNLHQIGTTSSRMELQNTYNKAFPLKYAGFNKFLERTSYHAFLHKEKEKAVLLLKLIELGEDIEKDLFDLLVFCDDNDMLEHHLIVDMRGTKGDQNVTNFLTLLFNQPIMGHQIKVGCSDIATSYFNKSSIEAEREIGQRIESSKEKFIIVDIPERELMFTSNHSFGGSIVFLFGKEASSGADQISSLLASNDLGYTIGSSTKGLGYHYIQNEEVKVSKGQYVQFPWPIAEVLKSDGKSLQGNPAKINLEIEKMGNVNVYTSQLLEAALEYLSKQP